MNPWTEPEEPTAGPGLTRLRSGRQLPFPVLATLMALTLVGVVAFAIMSRTPARAPVPALAEVSGETSPSAAIPIRPLPGVLSTEELVPVARTPLTLGRTVVAYAAFAALENEACYSVGCLVGEIRGVPVFIEPGIHPADLAWLHQPNLFAFTVGETYLELLGPVTAMPDSLTWPIPDAASAFERGFRGDLIVVDGWLVGNGGGWTCGPSAQPVDPPPPSPFNCAARNFITADYAEPVTAAPSTDRGLGGRTLMPPEGSLEVQWTAYDDFADHPAHDGLNHVPRRGMYLLRAVTYVAPHRGCEPCQGWRVIARVASERVIDPIAKHDAMEQAAEAQPDSPLPMRATAALVVRVRALTMDYRLPLREEALGGRPLAASGVTVEGSQARVEFHDYDTGETIEVLVALEANLPSRVLDVRVGNDTSLSAWEVELAEALATSYGATPRISGSGARTSSCPFRPGFCADVVLLDTSRNPSVQAALVTVDLGRETVTTSRRRP